MAAPLELLDALTAEGVDTFTFAEAEKMLARSPTATANVLRRLRSHGLIDRLGRGRYAIRPFGSLHTSPATDNLTTAVAATFSNKPHRIAYLSALSELGLLTHPVRTITVASVSQVRIAAISHRPLRVVIERPATIHLETEVVGRSWRSNLDRALFECALRLDLTGSVERLAEALVTGVSGTHAASIARLAQVFGPKGRAAERRLASLVRKLDLPLQLTPDVSARQALIRLDPREREVAWVDETFQVSWHLQPDELRAVVGS